MAKLLKYIPRIACAWLSFCLATVLRQVVALGLGVRLLDLEEIVCGLFFTLVGMATLSPLNWILDDA
jgi:hypothetical protein